MEDTEANGIATPEMDAVPADVNLNDRTESDLLADILARSEFIDDVPESLPDGSEDDVDPDESDSKDPMDDDESADDAEEVDSEESEDDAEDDEDASDEDATDEVQALEEEEVDWDVHVPVVIDGEQHIISLAELRKGYATEQHLSKKGRELGELRKEVEAEREAKIGEVTQLAEAMNVMLSSAEQQLAAEYHDIDKQINTAREEGNTYEISDLKDKREVAQQKYWEARKQRETLTESVQRQKQEIEVQQWNQKVEKFFNEITEVIPNYDEKYATELRNFGEELGLSNDFMQSVTDVSIVKALDDYRKLKKGVTAGAKKRAKAPIKKAPTKKAKPAVQKQIDADKMVKARAFREDASADDQMAFLRNYASKSLSNQ